MVVHRRRMEDELRASERRLREVDARKDHFLAILAHELRNPLAPIRSGLDLLQAQGATEEARERATAMMDRQLSHVVRLVDDLLDVSRIRTGKLQVTVQPIRLDEAIHAALEVVRPALKAKRHMLEIGGIDSKLRVAGDKVRLAQVFANLLNNAARYTPDKGRISVKVLPRGGSVDVEVSDNGPGLGADANRLFEAFYQAGGPASRQGMGLGRANRTRYDLSTAHPRTRAPAHPRISGDGMAGPITAGVRAVTSGFLVGQSPAPGQPPAAPTLSARGACRSTTPRADRAYVTQRIRRSSR